MQQFVLYSCGLCRVHVFDVRATLEGMVVVVAVEIVIPAFLSTALLSIFSRQGICLPGFVSFLFIGSIHDMFASSVASDAACVRVVYFCQEGLANYQSG